MDEDNNITPGSAAMMFETVAADSLEAIPEVTQSQVRLNRTEVVVGGLEFLERKFIAWLYKQTKTKKTFDYFLFALMAGVFLVYVIVYFVCRCIVSMYRSFSF